MADHHYFPHDLSNAATLAGWPTPVAKDDGKTPEAHQAMKHRMGERDGTGANRTAITSLQVMAQLAGWKTPCVPNGGRISSNPTDIGKHQDGSKAQIGLENEAKLSGWTTPTSTERSGQGPANESLALDAKLTSWPTPCMGDIRWAGGSITTVERKMRGETRPSGASIGSALRHEVLTAGWNVAPSTVSGETPIGYLLGPSGWEIVPASGQLNAAHSRWLMGLPKDWDLAGIAAFRSRKALKRGSKGFAATETG